jgi:hypothetical protein
VAQARDKFAELRVLFDVEVGLLPEYGSKLELKLTKRELVEDWFF